MREWITLVIAILLVVTNGAWVYMALDQAVTEKYRQQIEYEKTHQVESLKALASQLVIGKQKSEVEGILKSLFPEEVYEKEGFLNTYWMLFRVGPDNSIVDLEVSP